MGSSISTEKFEKQIAKIRELYDSADSMLEKLIDKVKENPVQLYCINNTIFDNKCRRQNYTMLMEIVEKMKLEYDEFTKNHDNFPECGKCPMGYAIFYLECCKLLTINGNDAVIGISEKEKKILPLLMRHNRSNIIKYRWSTIHENEREEYENIATNEQKESIGNEHPDGYKLFYLLQHYILTEDTEHHDAVVNYRWNTLCERYQIEYEELAHGERAKIVQEEQLISDIELLADRVTNLKENLSGMLEYDSLDSLIEKFGAKQFPQLDRHGNKSIKTK